MFPSELKIPNLISKVGKPIMTSKVIKYLKNLNSLQDFNPVFFFDNECKVNCKEKEWSIEVNDLSYDFLGQFYLPPEIMPLSSEDILSYEDQSTRSPVNLILSNFTTWTPCYCQ